MTEAAFQAMSSEVADANKLLREYQNQQGVFHCASALSDKIRSVMGEYERTTVSALQATKEFRDRMLIDLRAMSLVLNMVGNASTHREKDARLRGSIELLESAITRLRHEEFDIRCGRFPHFDDVFQADYPTRQFVERIHELERQVQELSKPQDQQPAASAAD